MPINSAYRVKIFIFYKFYLLGICKCTKGVCHETRNRPGTPWNTPEHPEHPGTPSGHPGKPPDGPEPPPPPQQNTLKLQKLGKKYKPKTPLKIIIESTNIFHL